jgi:hypothetical protein
MARTASRSLVAALLATAIVATGCGSDDPAGETTASSTTSPVESADASADALVGEWVTDNDCQALADALAEAGLEEFTVDMAKGGGLLPPGKPDPSDPCKGAEPVEHSHTFSANGDFNSYDESGKEVDFGTYELAGDDAFTLSRPPFEAEVRYSVDGDTATFDAVLPKCDTQKCRFGAALAVATFFPRTYERVK